MKAYIHKIALAALLLITGLAASSCRDFLSVRPANVQAVSTYEDVRALLGASLRVYRHGTDWDAMKGVSVFYMSGNEYLITHFYTDDYDPVRYLDNYTGKNNQADFYRSLDWRHPEIAEEIWTKYYSNIGFYNMILQELQKHPSGDTPRDNQVSAEARILRAWQFFRLMQYFAPYHSAELGLPLNTDADAVGSYDKRRLTQAECYSFILSELQAVLDYGTEPSPSYNVFYDKTFLHGLLAQVYLWKGDSGAAAPEDYKHAIEHATYVLTEGHKSYDYTKRLEGDPSMTLGIKKDRPYAVMSICEYQMDYAQSIAGIYEYSLPQYASQALLSLYRPGDLRRDDFFHKDGGIKKLSSMGMYYQMCIDLLTGAEMQLIIAESYARMGEEQKARQALMDFTRSRYETTPPLTDSESILEEILRERRREFCFEFTMRWLDMTRLQKGFSRPAVDKKEGGTYTLKDGDFRFTMPIPLNAELSENSIEQNPGWNKF